MTRSDDKSRCWTVFVLAAVVAVLVVGCAHGGTAEPTAAAPNGSSIVISGFEYHWPEEIAAGTQISVRNEDSVGHTVTSDEAGLFDVEVPPGGEAMLTVPDQSGEFPFHCTPHPSMTGTLVVR